MRKREAFEIRRHETGLGKGLDEDNGAFLKTDIWDPKSSGKKKPLFIFAF